MKKAAALLMHLAGQPFRLLPLRFLRVHVLGCRILLAQPPCGTGMFRSSCCGFHAGPIAFRSAKRPRMAPSSTAEKATIGWPMLVRGPTLYIAGVENAYINLIRLSQLFAF